MNKQNFFMKESGFEMLELVAIPVIQGLVSNFIYSGIQTGGNKLFSDNLSQQLEISILDAFDKLSEKYPVLNFQEGYTFWDYVAKRLTENLSSKDFSEEKITRVIKSLLEESLNSENNDYDIEEINSYFWHLLQREIILHNELYKYIVLTSNQEVKERVISVDSKLNSIAEEKDPTISEEELVDYLISLQQIYIKEIGNEFVPRSFKNAKNIVKSLSDIHRNLNENNNVLVLGEPGSGKTYVSKRTLYELTFDRDDGVNNRIPIFLNLAMFGYSFNSISEGIVLSLKNYMRDITENLIGDLLKQGKFVLLLDGLDEVREEFYEVCINELKETMQHMNENTFILTCRENTYMDELNYLVEPIKLIPLNKEQVNEVIRQSCNVPLYQLTKEHYELFSNPLLLNIGLEVINNNNGKLPSNRSSIFNKYVEHLLYKWERKKGLKRKYSLSYYKMVDFLSSLSFDKFDKPLITTLEFQEEINNKFPGENSNHIFEQIINTGIFVYNHTEEQISFSHKTFKEYFAGKFITSRVEKEKDYKFLYNIIDKKEWYEVFIFAAGLFNNWEKQNDYLNYILDNNLKLYVDCISAKNDFNEYLLSLSAEEYSNVYLHTLVSSYEAMIVKYFSQIKHQLYPYIGLSKNFESSTICVLGQISEDKKFLHFTLVTGERDQQKVRFVPPKEFEEYRNSTEKIIDNFINLELSNLMGDSARKVALDQLKSQLSDVLKEYRLNENYLLLCERVKEMKRSLPIKDSNDLSTLHQWLKEKLDSAQKLVGNDGVFAGYNYEGVELTTLYKYVDILVKGEVEYKNLLLPSQDLKLNRRGRIWEFYSKERLEERVKLFFEYYQKSFIYIVENNFYQLKDYFPDYAHLPYKFIVEIEFEGESSFEPRMSYYYIASDSLDDNEPEIKVVEKRSSWEEKENIIKKSFNNKGRFTNSIAIHSSGVTITMFERSSGKSIPLLSRTYDLVESNLEFIFGKL